MGLKFIVSEAQARSLQATQVSSQAQQAVSSLQQSIQLFLSAPLSSKAYDSAKNYFMVAYTPICQSIIMTAEAFTSAHKKFVSEYQATVGGEDIDEDKIQAEIDQYQELLHTIDDLIRDAKRPRPDLERRSMNAYEAMQKRKEKLEKLRTYSAQSTSFFSEYTSSQQELNTAINQVKDCKAWNASTGTFDISKLDMNWAKAITTRWKNREVAKAKQKEEAFNNNLKKLEGYTIYAWPYEDPVTGKVSVNWFIDKDGRRLDNSELQNFLEQHGTELDPSYYQIVDWKKIRDLENDALRRGETYITGQKYEGLSKGSIQLSGYISTGYAFAQDSGLYDLAMMAGLSYAGSKAKVSTPKKSSGTKPPKTDFGAENPVSGKDWNNYFKDKYGAGNVQWKPNSFEDIITNPQRLYGCTPNEIKSMLGDGWSFKSYGSNGLGWEFYSSEGRIFYHAGGGIHGGSYYGYATGPTGRVKIVDDMYIRTFDDKATIIPRDK
ncbi:T7SS effector LXG polymorphic toxin [Enterococcus ureilyticus]|uniref:T7SS effector LXG polymorphic toxin n=4 Tax=Enterococcus ureilyticus TaxID=1131292 RepID=UPI0009F2F779|nr:T7SS effector LXG polymorphic toxin [Enterococcus ureilyticus]